MNYLIHPKIYKSIKVYCDGKQVLLVNSTKTSLTVSIWSGNHPFFNKNQNKLDPEKRLVKFLRKYKEYSQDIK
uniref:50S ribosomal protein L31 n=1 Tax=Pterocladiophila hemisphaerica TaxID=2712948 RepID=A0A6M3WWB8_9FLOR|nr:ribosomal protein L31 [Pterocladiophila hemisphaerica]